MINRQRCTIEIKQTHEWLCSNVSPFGLQNESVRDTNFWFESEVVDGQPFKLVPEAEIRNCLMLEAKRIPTFKGDFTDSLCNLSVSSKYTKIPNFIPVCLRSPSPIRSNSSYSEVSSSAITTPPLETYQPSLYASTAASILPDVILSVCFDFSEKSVSEPEFDNWSIHYKIYVESQKSKTCSMNPRTFQYIGDVILSFTNTADHSSLEYKCLSLYQKSFANSPDCAYFNKTWIWLTKQFSLPAIIRQLTLETVLKKTTLKRCEQFTRRRLLLKQSDFESAVQMSKLSEAEFREPYLASTFNIDEHGYYRWVNTFK